MYRFSSTFQTNKINFYNYLCRLSNPVLPKVGTIDIICIFNLKANSLD